MEMGTDCTTPLFNEEFHAELHRAAKLELASQAQKRQSDSNSMEMEADFPS